MIEHLRAVLAQRVRRVAERLSAPFVDGPPLLCGCASGVDPACCTEA